MTAPLSANDVIGQFAGPHRFLSNFHLSPVRHNGLVFASGEHAFNAAKTTDPAQALWVQQSATPSEAKRRGRTVTLRADWDQSGRYTSMREILAAKFTDPLLRDALLGTGDALLVEGNTWGDQHWGSVLDSPVPGLNHLGRMLMALRSQLRGDPPNTWVRAAVTGHRPHLMNAEQSAYAQAELARLAVKLRDEHGTQVAINGAALGADTMWADAAAAAGLSVWAYCPFEDQAKDWSVVDQARWVTLRQDADRCVTLGATYDAKLFHARNEMMLRDCDVLIAVVRPSLRTGGTASTVRKARDAGANIVTVDLDTLTTRVALGSRD